MTRILVINSSPNTATSVSRALTSRFVDTWRQAVPDVRIVTRDVGANPPPHIDQSLVDAYYTPPEGRTSEQLERLALSEAIVDEAMEADIIVIGAPMHNFTITSGLKSWIDHLARVGRSFVYGENGPQGLLGGRKVYVLSTRGGTYGGGAPAAAMDMQTPYLQTVLGFVGLDDVSFINAEGLAGGDAGRTVAESLIDRSVAAHTQAAA